MRPEALYLAELAAEANRSSESRKNLLRQKLLMTTQKASEGVRAYADRHQDIARQLANIDDSLSDREMVNFLLKGIHPSMATLRDSLYAGQAAAGRTMAYNEIVNFMLTMEEMRTLGTITSPAQPLGRYGARQATVESTLEPEDTISLNDISEEEAYALVARFHRGRQQAQSGPPAGHPSAAEWFAGDCNIYGNPRHRVASCKLRARLLDGAGPGTRYEQKVAGRVAEADLEGDEIDDLC